MAQAKVIKSPQHAHVEWIDLYDNGVLHECVILKTDGQGNKFFFPTNHLDDVDRKRIAGILMDRNANNFELWDLMTQKTLGNGMNALAYFHQYVKVYTANGKILDPKAGQVGAAPSGTVKVEAA